MDKNLGHFNQTALLNYRAVQQNTRLCQRPDSTFYGVGMGKRCKKGSPVPKISRREFLVVLEKAQKLGLSNKEINSIIRQVKTEEGVKSIDNIKSLRKLEHKLKEFSRQKEMDKEDKQTPEMVKKENKKLNAKNIQVIAEKIKAEKPSSLPVKPTKPQPNTTMGYFNSDAVKLFREQATTNSRACQRPDGSIYRIGMNRNCVSGREISSSTQPVEQTRNPRQRAAQLDREKRLKRRKERMGNDPVKELSGRLRTSLGRLDVEKV